MRKWNIIIEVPKYIAGGQIIFRGPYFTHTCTCPKIMGDCVSPEESSRYPLDKWLGGPQSRSGRGEEGKKYLAKLILVHIHEL
jgi:hypothetical protein